MTDYNELRRAAELAQVDQLEAALQEVQSIIAEVDGGFAKVERLAKRNKPAEKMIMGNIAANGLNLLLLVLSSFFSFEYPALFVGVALLTTAGLITIYSGLTLRAMKKTADFIDDRIAYLDEIVARYAPDESEDSDE